MQNPTFTQFEKPNIATNFSNEKKAKKTFAITKKGITFAPVFAQVVKLVDTPA